MVTIKPNVEVAQRQDEQVEYRLAGWAGGAVSIDRHKPARDVSVPEFTTTTTGGDLVLSVRGANGVAGAQYRVTVGPQSFFLMVSGLIPCKPYRTPEGVKGVTRETLPAGHVYVNEYPFTSGQLVLVNQPVKWRR